MNDRDKNFHEIAVSSMLFKGHAEWYFCYLKSEKIAYVLALLAARAPLKDSERLEELVEMAAHLPSTVAQFVAGETELSVVLADLFSLLSAVRLAASRGYIHGDNAKIITDEYEGLVRRITAQSHPSPFLSAGDFDTESIPAPTQRQSLLLQGAADTGQGEPIKDIYKGHKSQGQSQKSQPKAAGNRMSLILDFVRKNKEVSIKDIAKAVRGCSEKTIQRELARLIEQGLVERRGERRWSTYVAAPLG